MDRTERATPREEVARERSAGNLGEGLEACRAQSGARAPVFTVVTVVTLALAIGSNTAIFSVVDAVLIDPLPFPEADRLVSIRGSAPGSELPGEIGVPHELYIEYRANASRLEDAGMYRLLPPRRSIRHG